jgi:hypothetical protein
MKSVWNVKTLTICAVLICGIVSASFLTIKRAKDRELDEHANLIRAQAERGDAAAEAERTLGPRRRSLNSWSKIFLIVYFTGGALLLGGSLRPGPQVRNRTRRASAMAGVFVLAYGGLDLFRYFGNSILLLSSAGTALRLVRDLLGGVSLAMLFLVVLTRKKAKTILIISCVLFVAYNLSTLAAYGLLHRAPKIRVFLLGIAWFVGSGVTSAIFLWLERQDGKNNRNDEVGPRNEPIDLIQS